MRKIHFTKYQGTGNDFVMLDNLQGDYNDITIPEIVFLCNRKTGIGADGLIKISKHEKYDFEVEYYNADGTQSFCGNGARCSVAFAHTLMKLNSQVYFIAIDGFHRANKLENDEISIEMLDVRSIEDLNDSFVLDTGSPHFVKFSDDKEMEIVDFGKEIRYSPLFREKGINVNLVEVLSENNLFVQTYERGVEDETLSCGTGVTACALAYNRKFNTSSEIIDIKTKGGDLNVSFEKDEEGYKNIWLTGPAVAVFKGEINV